MRRHRTEAGSVPGNILATMCIIILLPVLVIVLIGYAACYKVATDPVYQEEIRGQETGVRSQGGDEYR